MLLSLKYNFLYIHIAKTGGTSVRTALKPLRYRDPWYPLQLIQSQLGHISGHRIGCKLPRHGHALTARDMLPRSFFDQLFKFSFVRNPWDLQVSSYHHIQREIPQLIAHLDDFKSFLAWKFRSDRPTHYHLEIAHEPQSNYLVDMEGRMLVDFVGRYENLQEDYETVCREIGVSAKRLPEKRVAKRRGAYREYYDDESAEWVARHFAADIEMFGYRFDPV